MKRSFRLTGIDGRETAQPFQTIESDLQDLSPRLDLLVGFEPLEQDGPSGRIGHHERNEAHLREEESERNAQTFAEAFVEGALAERRAHCWPTRRLQHEAITDRSIAPSRKREQQRAAGPKSDTSS